MKEQRRQRLSQYLSKIGVVKMYTLLFSVTAVGVFFWHITAGKSFVWEYDGLQQYFPALMYYSGYLKKFIKALLFEQRFVRPMWEPALGEGADILTTLHYYGIGDPLYLLSAFVPQAFLPVLFDALLIVRLYLAGLFFLFLCRQTLLEASKIAMAAGALSYAFCFWALFYIGMYPSFLNALMYLPLLILGAYRVLEGKGFLLLTLSVAFAAASNLYLFYMLAFVTAIYVIEKLIAERRSPFMSLLRMSVFSVGGGFSGCSFASGHVRFYDKSPRWKGRRRQIYL